MAWQGHNLVPALGRHPWIHIVDDNQSTFAIRGSRWRVNTGRTNRAEVVFAVRGDDEFIPFGIVVPQQVLPSAHVTEEQQHVPVSDRPEIRTGAIISHQGKLIIFDKGVQILPTSQVFGTEKEVSTNRFPRRTIGSVPPERE